MDHYTSFWTTLSHYKTGLGTAVCLMMVVFLTGCASHGLFSSTDPAWGSSPSPRAAALHSDPQAAYRFGRYLQSRGQHDLALRELAKAVAADPSFAQAYVAMGMSYDYREEYGRAVACYTTALQHAPELHCAANNLGVSHLLQGNTEEAVRALQAAVRDAPEQQRYWNNLGLALAHAEKWDEALTALARTNGRPKAYRLLAQFCRLADDPARTRTYTALAAQAEDKVLAEAKPAHPKKPDATVVHKASRPPSVTPAPAPAHEPVRAEVVRKPRATLHQQRPKPSPSVIPIEDRGIVSARYPVIRIGGYGEGNRPDGPPGVEISNGNGVRHMAARVKAYLSGKGCRVTRLTNAAHFGFDRTTVLYMPGYLQSAYDIAREIPGWQEMEEVQSLDREDIQIRVRIGRDIVRFDTTQFAAL